MSDAISLKFEGNLALLTMDDGKGNALGKDALEAFEVALRDAATKAGALLLRGRAKVFCGGLDLPSLVGLPRAELEKFLALFNRVHDLLLGYPIPIVTAARGSAVAGGAILFATGDARLMTPNGKVGINEAVLGLNIPTSALEIVRIALGERGTSEAAQTGRIYEGDERVRIGFVTEVVEAEKIDERAIEVATAYAKNDRRAVRLLRAQLRRPSLDRVAAAASLDTNEFLDLWYDNSTQERLREIVSKLTR